MLDLTAEFMEMCDFTTKYVPFTHTFTPLFEEIAMAGIHNCKEMIMSTKSQCHCRYTTGCITDYQSGRGGGGGGGNFKGLKRYLISIL